MLGLGRLHWVGRSGSTVRNNPTNLTDPTGFEAATATVSNTTNGITVSNTYTQIVGNCPEGAVCADMDGGTWQLTSTTVSNEQGKSVTIDWTGGASKANQGINAANRLMSSAGLKLGNIWMPGVWGSQAAGGGTVFLSASDIRQSWAAGFVNSAAKAGTFVVNLMIAMSPGDAELIQAPTLMVPVSERHASQGETVFDGLATAEGGRDFGKMVSSLSAPKIIQKGGAWKDVHGMEGYEAHHMPADSVSPHSHGSGPTIAMLKEDHKLTASWGRSREANSYRQAQAKLIKEGKFMEAVQMDIIDIRSKFGSKYDPAIKQMLEYMKAKGIQ